MKAFLVMVEIQTKNANITSEQVILGESEDVIYKMLVESFGKKLVRVQFLN